MPKINKITKTKNVSIMEKLSAKVSSIISSARESLSKILPFVKKEVTKDQLEISEQALREIDETHLKQTKEKVETEVREVLEEEIPQIKEEIHETEVVEDEPEVIEKPETFEELKDRWIKEAKEHSDAIKKEFESNIKWEKVNPEDINNEIELKEIEEYNISNHDKYNSLSDENKKIYNYLVHDSSFDGGDWNKSKYFESYEVLLDILCKNNPNQIAILKLLIDSNIQFETTGFADLKSLKNLTLVKKIIDNKDKLFTYEFKLTSLENIYTESYLFGSTFIDRQLEIYDSTIKYNDHPIFTEYFNDRTIDRKRLWFYFSRPSNESFKRLSEIKSPEDLNYAKSVLDKLAQNDNKYDLNELITLISKINKNKNYFDNFEGQYENLLKDYPQSYTFSLKFFVDFIIYAKGQYPINELPEQYLPDNIQKYDNEAALRNLVIRNEAELEVENFDEKFKELGLNKEYNENLNYDDIKMLKGIINILDNRPNLKNFIIEKCNFNRSNNLNTFLNYFIKYKIENDDFKESLVKITKLISELRGKKEDISTMKINTYDDDLLRLLENPDILPFMSQVYKDTSYNFLEKIEKHSYTDSKLSTMTEWYENQDIYYFAKGIGLFHPNINDTSGEYTSIISKYHTVEEISQNKELIRLLGQINTNYDEEEKNYIYPVLFHNSIENKLIFSKIISDKNYFNFLRDEKLLDFKFGYYEQSLIFNDNNIDKLEELYIDNDLYDKFKKYNFLYNTPSVELNFFDKYDILKKWIEKEDHLQLAIDNKILQKGTFDKNILNSKFLFEENFYENFWKINKEDFETISLLCKKIKGKLIEENKYNSFIHFVIDKENENLLDYLLKIQSLYYIKFHNKYNVRNIKDNQFEWINSLDPAVLDQLIKDAGNIDSSFLNDYEPTSHRSYEIEQLLLTAKDDEAVEKAKLDFNNNTKPLYKTKKVIDFIEISKLEIKTIEELEIIKKLADTFEMRDVAEHFNFIIDKTTYTKKDLELYAGFIKEFSLLKSNAIYDLYVSIYDKNEIPDQLIGIIKSTGKEGIKELKLYIKKIYTKLINDEENINPNELNDIELGIYRHVLKFDSSDWPRPGKNFKKILEKLYDQKENNELAKIDEAFTTETVKLRSIPQDLNLYKHKHHFDAVIELVNNGLADLSFEENKNQLLELFKKDKEEKNQILLTNPSNEKFIKIQIENLDTFIGELENLNSNEEIINKISLKPYKIKGIERVIHNIIISDYSNRSPENKDKLLKIIESPELNKENVDILFAIINNQIKEHSIGNNKDKNGEKDWLYPNLKNKQRSNLKKYFPTGGLDIISKVYEKSTSKELDDKFVFQPSHYIMGEMSGYIADACWTSRDSIIKNNPNMTPIMCIKEAEENSEIVGTYLVFENSLKNGEKVLILRGINPGNKYTSKFSCSSFCDEVLRYAEKVAKSKGIKYIVASPKQGIISNRPGVTAYFKKFYEEPESSDEITLNQVVQLENEMNFNGYNITNSCRVVSIV